MQDNNTHYLRITVGQSTRLSVSRMTFELTTLSRGCCRH